MIKSYKLIIVNTETTDYDKSYVLYLYVRACQDMTKKIDQQANYVGSLVKNTGGSLLMISNP